MKTHLVFKLSLLLLFTAYSCRSDLDTNNQLGDFAVNVRLKEDPGRINPMFTSNAGSAREIYPYIFLQLGEYDPISLQLTPILAATIPEKVEMTEGEYKGGIKYNFKILEDAVWDDGSPIDSDDISFTLKVAKHPLVQSPSYRAFLSPVIDVILPNPENKKEFVIILEKDLAHALELVLSFEIFPEHIYDPNGDLSSIPLIDFYNEEKVEGMSLLPGFEDFSKRYNDVLFQQEVISGSGPYNLVAWETDQYIQLKRKENWWGNKYPERTFLQANPSEITFHFIPDETTASTQLNAGAIDFMAFDNGDAFSNFQKQHPDKFEFHTPQLSRLYYILLNNKSDKLSDVNVRTALAHLLDVDNIIETMENGYGKRSSGIILPFREEYNSDISVRDFNVEKAKELLNDAGWVDSDNNGTLDKEIYGNKTELDMRFYVSSGKLGQRIALVLQQNAKLAGINIEIIQKAYRSIVRDNIATNEFEMTTLALTTHIGQSDAYDKWHSDNSGLGGSNQAGYSNTKVDVIIEQLKVETDEEERIQLYRELQSIMYDDQPSIFLYSPVAKLASSTRINPTISVKRPGYFLQKTQVNQEYSVAN